MTPRNRRLLSKLGVYAMVLAAIVVLLFPLYWMLITSLRPDNTLLTYPPRLFPGEANWNAYRLVLSESQMFRWFLNSAFVTAFTIALAVPISTLAGYTISRFKYVGIREVGYSLLVARMLPSSLLIIPLYFIFAQLGMLNNYFALVIANATFVIPFSTWMMKGFFDSIPRELEDAAQIDGASAFQALVRVVVPLSVPGLAATTIYAAILTWGEFVFAVTLLSGEERWTGPVGVASFIQQYLIQWNEIMAASLVFILPVIVLFAFLERFLVQGLAAGSVKQ